MWKQLHFLQDASVVKSLASLAKHDIDPKTMEETRQDVEKKLAKNEALLAYLSHLMRRISMSIVNAETVDALTRLASEGVQSRSELQAIVALDFLLLVAQIYPDLFANSSGEHLEGILADASSSEASPDILTKLLKLISMLGTDVLKTWKNISFVAQFFDVF